jgi:hypothetical protein
MAIEVMIRRVGRLAAICLVMLGWPALLTHATGAAPHDDPGSSPRSTVVSTNARRTDQDVVQSFADPPGSTVAQVLPTPGPAATDVAAPAATGKTPDQTLQPLWRGLLLFILLGGLAGFGRVYRERARRREGP